MKNRYRIVSDRFAGYEVQRKFWWFPFLWLQVGINTHVSVERAEEFVKRMDFVKYC